MKDAYPYLIGALSEKFKCTAIPFDGVLFVSGMMTAQEAHTSSNVGLPWPIPQSSSF